MNLAPKSLQKLMRDPVLFARDALIKRRPLMHNEIGVPVHEERVIVSRLQSIESAVPNALDVDVVFTWVDDSDPKWRERKAAALAQIDQHVAVGQHATDDARFANHDELRYSLASVRRFMPWVRRIFLVTDRQRPWWLKPEDGVTVIDHSQIIESKYLPTFNSHVIEACLHRIPGLAEHFVYFNDDVFAARPLHKSHFFRSNGIASIFLAEKSLEAMLGRGMKTPTLEASLHGAALLRQRYGVEVDRPLVHTYSPQIKSIHELLWTLYSEQIEAFLPNRFRGANDLNLPTFLAPWTAYLEGLATPSLDVCRYFNVRSKAAKSNWEALLASSGDSRPHSFCANDFHAGPDAANAGDVSKWLKAYFEKA